MVPDVILVTGGAGFIGSHVVRLLLEKTSARVVNVDCLTYASTRESLGNFDNHPRHCFVQGNICHAPTMRAVFAEHRPDAVIHLAAETHVDRSIDDPRIFFQTNVEGTLQLLEAARLYWNSLATPDQQRFRFLHVSTDEVYGDLSDAASARENSPLASNSPYAASKAAAEHLAQSYFRTFGFPILTTRGTNTYGPFQFPEKLIPLMIINALDGRPLPVYGDGEQQRQWLHVSDHARALVAALTRGRPGECYNIGGDTHLTNLQVVRNICQHADRILSDPTRTPTAALIHFVTDRPGHDRRYAVDSSKAQSELDWRATTAFDEGLAETVRWYAENRAWSKNVSRGEFLGQRLGLSAPITATDEGTIADVVLRPLARHADDRGWLSEIFRVDELPVPFSPAMTYVSETKPGVTRGPHEHTDQTDYFAFLGPEEFELFLWDARRDSSTVGQSMRQRVGGEHPCIAIIPPGVVHAYRNVGAKPGWVINLPDRLYRGWQRRDPVDEIRHESDPNSPYRLSPTEPNG